MKGRKPKPGALRLIEGNREHRPIGREPQPTEAKPTCPKHVTGESRKAFRLICKELGAMGILRRADTGVIVSLGSAIGILSDARAQFVKEGSELIVQNPKTLVEQQNPLLGIINKQIELISRLSAQLALDPTARARIAAPEKKKRSLRSELSA